MNKLTPANVAAGIIVLLIGQIVIYRIKRHTKGIIDD